MRPFFKGQSIILSIYAWRKYCCALAAPMSLTRPATLLHGSLMLAPVFVFATAVRADAPSADLGSDTARAQPVPKEGPAAPDVLLDGASQEASATEAESTDNPPGAGGEALGVDPRLEPSAGAVDDAAGGYPADALSLTAPEPADPSIVAEAATAPALPENTDSEGENEEVSGLIEELTYEQHPGLPLAASKIFFAKRPWTISGFGEMAYTAYLGDKNRDTGDIELYNTNLYRFVLYGAYRPTKWLVLYAEAFAEVLHDGFREIDFEVLPEVFADFTISRPFGLRVGFSQMPIGYINNNDEPVMFYSVSRPEVERLIIPSQWLPLSVQAYGRLGDSLTYMLTVFQGVDGEDMLGASWLRQGRDVGFNVRTPGLGAQVNYSPIDKLELSLSGVAMESGNRQRVTVDGAPRTVHARTLLLSGYARYAFGDFSLLALGSMGMMGETDLMYELTGQGPQGPQVLGSRTYGYYFDVGWDMLPTLRGAPSGPPNRRFFYRTDEMQLPIFVRYERLNTHAALSPVLQARLTGDDRINQSDLDIITVGLNFMPRRNLVLKANVQFRRNRARFSYLPEEGHRIETGLGFIF